MCFVQTLKWVGARLAMNASVNQFQEVSVYPNCYRKKEDQEMKKSGVAVLVFAVFICFQLPLISNAKGEKMKVYNPTGIKPEIRKIPMAPRPGNIDGKTIYIVDTKYPNTKPFVGELHAGLKNQYPETNWVVKEKFGGYMDDDPKLWKETKANADGAIVLVGH